MAPNEPASRALALRLRDLRKSRWEGLTITQQQLATAFGGDKPLSESLISSWESESKPVTPPPPRLRAYATFFATRRSVEGGRPRLLTDAELTEDERAERDNLYEELLAPSGVGPQPNASDLIPDRGAWYFPDGKSVSIVCARLPKHLRERMPYTDPTDPDYVRSYTYADVDSLIDLYGHIRSVNPSVRVNTLSPDPAPRDAPREDDYSANLAVLGGVDWNPVARDLLKRSSLPIRQEGRMGDDIHAGHFKVTGGDGKLEFRPVLEEQDGKPFLREDVAMVYRAKSPYNSECTVTMCNGMYSRGTYAAVRALTDQRFLKRNEDYLRERFAGQSAFAILTRVAVVNGEAMTPDWTVEDNRLYEWSEA